MEVSKEILEILTTMVLESISYTETKEVTQNEEI